MPPIGREFKPKEPYTRRLSRILEEYPDGSQILREILQNSDDSHSVEQIFILDHNTYPSNKLFDLKLDRYQGPALLSRNTTIFEEKDFKSLLKLADSEKRDQFDKIGVMGVGFNSIYHITDSPSFITDDKYVILDPHEWCFDGGVQYDFVKQKLVEEYPDQFAPFRIPCDRPFKGTIFRYPLRNSTESDISKKLYKPEEILDMFHKFYENESINCLLFLKYIERILFYELKEGATEPDLLYTILLENANQIREQRYLISKNIVLMMNSLNSGELNSNNRLETSYVASFCRQKGDFKENSEWLILNYLDDLFETEKNFDKNIRDHKFIPNVGLAVPLNDLNVTGRLFCFLPLPISMPFLVSVHGHFAVSTNRRSLWSAADNEDLADDAIARLKVKWNQYLFEQVLPKAWVKLLRELPLKVSNIQSDDLYKFWPEIKESTSSSISFFCKDLLQKVIENLDIEDRVFKGPSSSNTIGALSEISSDSYDAYLFKESEFHWLSISSGYFEDKKAVGLDLSNIGFPVISLPQDIFRVLENSRHKDTCRFFSPAIIRAYLKHNSDRWQEGVISRREVLQLFEYILNEPDQNFEELEGFQMIPLADGTLGTLTQSSGSYVYICPITNHDEHIEHIEHIEHNIFKDQLDKFIDKSIDRPYGLYKRLYNNAKAGWNLNIKILNDFVVADMIKLSLNYNINEVSRNLGVIIGNIGNYNEEIPIPDHFEWIYQVWEYLKYREWNLTKFEDIHLIPTSRSTLRKLNTSQKIFSSKNLSMRSLIPIFKKFGAVFVENEFDLAKISNWDKISPYIINPDEIISVLNSFHADTSYPGNLNHTLQNHEASALIEYLSIYLPLAANKSHLEPELIEVIKHLPIFTKVDDHTSSISLLPGNKEWYLLPREIENSYGKIIYPSDKGGFLIAGSQNIFDIIKIHRLTVNDYWEYYVIPFLESQQPIDIDIVIDKLFDQLQSLLDHNANLKYILREKAFVPAGTFEMSQQLVPAFVKLAKPAELFDPKEKTIVDLFFDDEQVFPVGKYGISQELTSKKFFSSLKLLEIKSALSSDDIISRINAIITRKQVSDVQEKALKLFKYIDENWDKLHASLVPILGKEWIPTVDEFGRKILSKPQDCYCKNYKYLVCLAAPVLDYDVKNVNLLKVLNWHTHPDVKTVLRQLEICRNSMTKNKPPKALKSICYAIYKYMNDTFQANDETSKEEFNYMKEYLKNKSWILCRDSFHSSDKVVINLPNRFKKNNSLISKLPIEYTVDFGRLFKSMGVRNEIEAKDLIIIIENLVEEDKNKYLSVDEVDNVIQILEQIVEIRKDGEELDGLLVPSTENKLVDLDKIHFDDMGERLSNEKKINYKIAHRSVKPDIAKGLGIQTLKGKIFVNNSIGEIDWRIYDQIESLTNKIKDIIKGYSISSIFKEFLKNADGAGATKFLVIVDERQNFRHDFSKKSFLSEEMENWQGPAIWIYNEKKFTNEEFQSLLNLGGGFNCAFHITDLPSFVSGRYIAFLDPHANFLPPSGFPPKRSRGTRIDFCVTEFKQRFPDQCYPYEAIFDFIKNLNKTTEGYNFSEDFEGTLFRLPLRTSKLAKVSDISSKVIDINKIMEAFINIENNEMLFLRNIDLCSLYQMKDSNLQLVWQTKISKIDEVIDSIDGTRIYQLDIERINNIQNTKISEIWLLCTGGHHDIIDQNLKEFSCKRQLKPIGGVASLLAQSDNKSFDELRTDSFPNPPELVGKIYSCLSLSIISKLGVHLNGNFSIPRGILQSENGVFQASCDDAKWNRYILYKVLPDLHIKLLEYVVKLEEARHEKKRTNFIPHTANSFWPIPIKKNKKNPIMDLFKDYGLNVIKRLGLKNQRIFWTEVDGGRFISLWEAEIFEKEEMVVADILASLEVLVVKLDKDKIEQLNEIVESENSPIFPYRPVTGESVCEKLHTVSNIHDMVDNKKCSRDSLFKLLNFILQDKNSFEILTGLPLVPLSNESVGKFGEVYYIGKEKHLELFPEIGPSKFVSTDLPDNLRKIFNDDDFSAFTNIKKFDAGSVLDLLMYELRPLKELKWNPSGEHIPNNNWLKNIWSILNKAENIEFSRLSKFPLLPVIQPSILIRPDMKYPLLYTPENGHTLYPVLVKLKVRFTNMIFPESAHKELKKCVVTCNAPIDIINSLECTCSLLHMTMNQLFNTSDLSPLDYEKFRIFIKEGLKTLIEHGENNKNFMNILKSLPIWPIHSSEERFIDAMSGNLLTYNIPFFSFHKNTNFYKCDNKLDFIALTKLRQQASYMNELTYFRDYIIPDLKDFQPSQNYITFLRSVLSLRNQGIENLLKSHEAIPNKSLIFARADTLYDMNVALFLNIFDTDKFLPPELQNGSVCLENLERIGLNRRVNCRTYIKCAQEIESQSQQADKFPMNIVKHRAKYLVDYLYTHILHLDFSSVQWGQIMRIKFIPSEILQSPFYEGAKETLGFESFAVLCFQRYKEVCWSERPLFERGVEPINLFCQRFPTIGKPSPEDIIKHWFFVVEKIRSRPFTWSSTVIKNAIEKIYIIMNEFSQEEKLKGLIKSSINTKEKLFLNGDDPLDEMSWVAGRELVFETQDIEEGMYKVKKCLMPYKKLLLLAGAYEMTKSKYLEKDIKIRKHVQKDILTNLLDKLNRQSDNEYHDVFFTFDNERIGANRYVLSATSTYFKSMFYGGLSESVKSEIEISIKDIHPDTFWILLRWLYGQEDAIPDSDNFRKGKQYYTTDYLTFLVDLLRTTDIYDVDSLKNEVKDIIIRGQYISVRNLYKILKCSDECDAKQLREYYENHIRSNRELVEAELCRDTVNSEERSTISLILSGK